MITGLIVLALIIGFFEIAAIVFTMFCTIIWNIILLPFTLITKLVDRRIKNEK